MISRGRGRFSVSVSPVDNIACWVFVRIVDVSLGRPSFSNLCLYHQDTTCKIVSTVSYPRRVPSSLSQRDVILYLIAVLVVYLYLFVAQLVALKDTLHR